ncbi:MAG: S8 family serine peptidase [Anaerolineae bacterium]
MKRSLVMLVVLALLLSVVAGASAQAASRSYLILSNGNSFPRNLATQIAAAGGTITRTIPEVGIIVATSSNPNFSRSISGVRSVIANAVVQWTDPNEQIILDEDFGNPPSSGDNDTRFNLQWGHDAVNAVEAWNAGQFGHGVRVAVLDSGIDADHPDIAPNLNTALSTSFVPGEGYDVHPGLYFNHGTHVAGTIGAADNGVGIIGVAPQVELVAVKVLSEYSGSGSFEGVIAGIIYAASPAVDADIINMSLGGVLPRSGFVDDDGTVVGANEVSELVVAINRAVAYAYQQGTTVIVSAGNDAIDRDHDANTWVLPADAPHAITIAATAPVGWALDPTTNLNVPTSYTNFGRSRIDFAAPGGDIWDAVPASNCTVAGVTRPCYVFDLVFSAVSGGYGWAGGTSMAAPHVSGVAAIIIGENGGSMSPAHVEQALRARAVGQGNDPYLGAGVVTTGY